MLDALLGVRHVARAITVVVSHRIAHVVDVRVHEPRRRLLELKLSRNCFERLCCRKTLKHAIKGDSVLTQWMLRQNVALEKRKVLASFSALNLLVSNIAAYSNDSLASIAS